MIEPTHLLLGLCKVVDLDLTDLVSKAAPDRDEMLEELLREVRKLRTIFRAAGLDAKTFRRQLRRTAPDPRFSLTESTRLRRNSATKEIFADAERFAQLGGGTVNPVHLLYASLLMENPESDATLAKLGISKRNLLKITKRAVIKPQIGSSSESGKEQTRWN